MATVPLHKQHPIAVCIWLCFPWMFAIVKSYFRTKHNSFIYQIRTIVKFLLLLLLKKTKRYFRFGIFSSNQVQC